MTRTLLIPVLCALAACASPPHEAPGCRGPKRPANPHGSVLVAERAPTPAPAPAIGGAACLAWRP